MYGIHQKVYILLIGHASWTFITTNVGLWIRAKIRIDLIRAGRRYRGGIGSTFCVTIHFLQGQDAGIDDDGVAQPSSYDISTISADQPIGAGAPFEDNTIIIGR